MILSRRSFLLGGTAFIAGSASIGAKVEAASAAATRLRAGPAQARLGGPDRPPTEVWAYNGSVPGPTLRFRQGEQARILVENALAEETTVHWHGIRVPNAMDGVPYLTQKPIAPGETFLYEFAVPDAGTYWYHPHLRSFEQVGRGLYGAFIVDEEAPPPVDRDIVWVLGDWRLMPDARIAEDFGNLMEMSMSGRIGNTVTVDGRRPGPFAVHAGERIRLRLINAAPARIFGLRFDGHRPLVIALDGQPVAPHEPAGGRIVLGPAMRADLLIAMTGNPRDSFAVRDDFYPNLAYTLLELRYLDEPLQPSRPAAGFAGLPANTVPEPDIANAERHEIVLGGGMMSGMMGGMMSGGTMGGMMTGHVWTINGVSSPEHVHAPRLVLQRNISCVFAIRNETAWNHPIHLHGHVFRVIARNGQATPHREWRDTVLVAPRESVDIAFVADNPGDWMIHCHVLEHQAGGMMGVFRVT